MRIVRYGIVLIMLLFIIGGAAALLPDSVVVSTDKPWVIAGGTDTSTVQVMVVNASNPGAPVVGAEVTAWCDDPLMGTISTPTLQKVMAGIQNVTFTFRSGTKSGDAIIRVSVNQTGLAVPVTGSGIQKVDHAIPKNYEQIVYPASLSVGTNATILIRLKDQYGNIVDDLRNQSEYSENITFLDSPDGGGFWENGLIVHKLVVKVNSTGYATALYNVPTTSGISTIQVAAPSSVISNIQWINIRGTALDPKDGGGILSIVSPGTTIPANGIDTATILYTVIDKYGNSVPSYTFKWWSNIGESIDLTTNAQGQAYIIYGPKSSVASITLYAGFITSIPVRSDVINFMSLGPIDFLLTASPNIIPSLDMKSNSSAEVRVKVVDGFGNPVEGESVSFALTDASTTPAVKTSPYINISSGVTDAQGYATTYLIPGTFPRPGDTAYNITEHLYATGTATVRASWSGMDKEIIIQYKNYPHLRIETEVVPENITVGDEVEVTIRIIGDGYALKKPVDVMLMNDRSNSMLDGINSNNDQEDRMLHAMIAAKAFIGAMDNGFDRVGISSFGDKSDPNTTNLWNDNKLWAKAGTETSATKKNEPYHDAYIQANYKGNGTHIDNDFTTIDRNLTAYFQDGDIANTTIENLIPYNTFVKDGQPENQFSASLRHGLYKTVTYMKDDYPTYTKTRTIVGLIDTDFTWYGNPLAASSEMTSPFAATGGNAYWPFENPNGGGYAGQWSRTNPTTTLQNMSNYAKANNIKVFMVVYSSGSVNSEGIINTLCTATGGQKYHASTPQELIDRFLEIARTIRRLAGVDTAMDIDFGTVNVTIDNVSTEFNGSEVFEYVYEPSVSTYITKYDSRNPGILLQPPPAGAPSPTYPYTIDHSAEWNSTTPHLNFVVGNMSIDETWVGHFKLRAKKAGIINIFGNNSAITYSDDSGGSPQTFSLSLPDTYLIVTEDPHEQVITQNLIDIIDGSLVATPEQSTELLNISWLLNYTGNESVKQIAYYQFSTNQNIWSNDWIQFHTNTTGLHPITAESYSAFLDVRDHVGWIRVRVHSYEEPLGGPSDDEEITDPFRVGLNRSTSIKIS